MMRHRPNTLQVSGAGLLALRHARIQLVATIDPAVLSGGNTFRQTGDALIVTLDADQGSGFTQVARPAMFILLNTASGNAPQGPPVEYCGDTVLQPAIGVHYDDGCNLFCAVEFSGDEITQSPEQCDDGNTNSGDGCSAICTLEGVAPVPALGGRGGLMLVLMLLATGESLSSFGGEGSKTHAEIGFCRQQRWPP